MAVTRRYASWPPGEVAQLGMDFSDVLPIGTAIQTASLLILVNQSPTLPQTDFTQGAATIQGRQAWVPLQGGNAGTDYQCRWTVTDNLGNTWQRTALLLCAESS